MQQKVEKLQEKPKFNEVNKEATDLEALLETHETVSY